MAIAMRAGEELDFPPGYGLDSMGDMTDMMIEFDRLLKGLIVSIILIYLILVIQFGSFIQPLVMMLSIPLQLIGVFGALLLAQQTLSSVSILGIIILSGISVNNLTCCRSFNKITGSKSFLFILLFQLRH